LAAAADPWLFAAYTSVSRFAASALPWSPRRFTSKNIFRWLAPRKIKRISKQTYGTIRFDWSARRRAYGCIRDGFG
jgi:hypothetical protein